MKMLVQKFREKDRAKRIEEQKQETPTETKPEEGEKKENWLQRKRFRQFEEAPAADVVEDLTKPAEVARSAPPAKPEAPAAP